MRNANSAVDSYERIVTSPGRRAELWLRMVGSKSGVFRAAELSPRNLLQSLWLFDPPSMAFHSMSPLRHRRVQAELAPGGMPSTGGVIAGTVRDRPVSDPDRDSIIARIDRATWAIVERGGSAVLVYLPACGERKRQEDLYFARDRFWEALAAGTRVPTVHYDDFPELNDLQCGDGSHVEWADTPRFTSALARIVSDVVPATDVEGGR